MKKIFFIVFILGCYQVNAENYPCSGKMGGIAKCSGTKFVCKNGKISKSKSTCNKSLYGKN